MLPKKRRLTGAEVRSVLALGKGVRSGVLSLKYVENKGHFRAVVVAPKSVAKRAVDRNRLRRALYLVLSKLPKDQSAALHNITGVFFIRGVPTPLVPTLRENVGAIVAKL